MSDIDTASVPIASFSNLTAAIRHLGRAKVSVAAISENDLGLSPSTAHQVAATLRALRLIDRAGTTTPAMRQLVDGTTNIADVLVGTYSLAVAIVREGGSPHEFDERIRQLYGTRKSWQRFRRLLLDAIAHTEPDVDLTPFRYLTRRTNRSNSPAAAAAEAAQLELGMYLELLQTAMDNQDVKEQERISRHTAKLRKDLRGSDE